MTDAQIEMWLKRLMEYHGPIRIELKMTFDDGSTVTNVCKGDDNDDN